MTEENKETQELVKEVEDTSYPYGDLTVICGKCGAEQTIDTNIPRGIQLNLLTNHKSMLDLKCQECESHMTLKFKPAVNPPEEEPETMTHTVTEEDIEMNEGEDLKEGEEVEIPKEAVVNEDVQEKSNEG